MNTATKEVATLKVSDSNLETVRSVVNAQMIYERATNCGRKFGITGEVDEILVCRTLGLELVKDPRSEGFDAGDEDGCRVQIKTRRGENDDRPPFLGT